MDTHIDSIEAVPNRPAVTATGSAMRSATLCLGYAVVLIALVSALYYMFAMQETEYTRYTLAILLVIFALSTVTSLLFANTESMLKATLNGVTLAIFGPAVIWIGFFFGWMKYGFSTENFTALHSDDKYTVTWVAKLTSEIESRAAKTYHEYMAVHPEYVDRLTGASGETLVKEYLHYAYEPEDRPEQSIGSMTHVSIATLFVYDRRGVIFKVQRIQGIRRGTNDVYIPFDAHSTNPDKFPKSIVWVRDTEDGRNGEIDPISESSRAMPGFAKIGHAKVDCLVISRYDDLARDDLFDFIVVPTRRFAASGEPTELDLSILDGGTGFVPESNMWSIRRPFAAVEGSSPLLFEQLEGHGPLDGVRLKARFGDWFRDIDARLDRGWPDSGEDMSLLRSMRNEFVSQEQPDGRHASLSAWLDIRVHDQRGEFRGWQFRRDRLLHPVAILLRRSRA